MISTSNTDVSTSSTATGASIFSQSTLLTNVTSIVSHLSLDKGLAALVNVQSIISETASSVYSTPENTTPSLRMVESTTIHSDICENLTADDSSSMYSIPEITTSYTAPITVVAPISAISLVSTVAPSTGIRAAITRYSTARQHRKAQKSATKAARKSENRARARAYFADFYADDKVGAWHNALATDFCLCGCNDDPFDGKSCNEDLVPVDELIKMQTNKVSVTRMVDGRPVMINF